MQYVTRRPRAPVSEFVSDIWLYSGYRPPHRFERILPSGTLELVVNLCDRPLHCYHPQTLEARCAVSGPLVSGARAAYSVVDTAQQQEIMGVHLRPGGAPALLGVPADEVEGADLPLEAFWGRAAVELRDRLLAESDADARLATLEDVLTRQVRPALASHPVLRAALERLDRPEDPIAIGALAADAGWSRQRFIRTFRAGVGLTPKAYARVRRFQAALRRFHAGGAAPWVDVAAACGYYDQAHFIRDFRAFSGLTPAAYARLEPGPLRLVPVAERPQVCPVTPAEGASAASW